MASQSEQTQTTITPEPLADRVPPAVSVDRAVAAVPPAPEVENRPSKFVPVGFKSIDRYLSLAYKSYTSDIVTGNQVARTPQQSVIEFKDHTYYTKTTEEVDWLHRHPMYQKWFWEMPPANSDPESSGPVKKEPERIVGITKKNEMVVFLLARGADSKALQQLSGVQSVRDFAMEHFMIEFVEEEKA